MVHSQCTATLKKTNLMGPLNFLVKMCHILFPRKIAISFKYKEGSVLPIIDCNFFIFERFCNLYLIDCLFFIEKRFRNLSYKKKVQSLGERSRNLWREILWKNETFFSIERYCNLSCLKNGLLYSKDCDFFHIKIAGFYNFERLYNCFYCDLFHWNIELFFI